MSDFVEYGHGDRLEAARHLVALVDGIVLHGAVGPASWTPEHQFAHRRARFGGLSTA